MDKITGKERLNALLQKQHMDYRRRMWYIQRRLRWPWGPWFVGGDQ